MEVWKCGEFEHPALDNITSRLIKESINFYVYLIVFRNPGDISDTSAVKITFSAYGSFCISAQTQLKLGSTMLCIGLLSFHLRRGNKAQGPWCWWLYCLGEPKKNSPA